MADIENKTIASDASAGTITVEALLVSGGLTWALVLLFVCFIRTIYSIYKCERQKAREPQQPRMYVSSVRERGSIGAQPAIYITPVNMPPPKYEVLAPPSYEEVVGIHYPATLAIVAPQPSNNITGQSASHSQPTSSQATNSQTNSQPTDSQTNSQPINSQPASSQNVLTTITVQ